MEEKRGGGGVTYGRPWNWEQCCASVWEFEPVVSVSSCAYIAPDDRAIQFDNAAVIN